VAALRKRMSDLGVTQEIAAERMGITHGRLAAAIVNRTEPLPDLLAKARNKLGVEC
jgi:hypothetical protein